MDQTPPSMQVDNRMQFPEGFMPCFSNPWEMTNAMSFNQNMALSRSLLMNMANNGRQFAGNMTPQALMGQLGKNAEVKAPRKKRTRRKKWKKPKDKPKRPLSAYNLFFQEERERMIRGEASSDTRRGLGFGEMARVIASKWNRLVPERRFWYEKGAEEEKKKYFMALAEWKKNKEHKNEEPEAEAEAPKTPPKPTKSSSSSVTESLSDSVEETLSDTLSESLEETLSSEVPITTESDTCSGDLFTPISLEDAMEETHQDVLEENIPEMERVLATISDLKDSYDDDFVDFVSTLDFKP